MARTACLVCFISTVNGHYNKKKEEAYTWKASASSGHTTNLKQSILRLSISMLSPLSMWMFHKPTCVKQTSFLRYLWLDGI